MSPLSHLPALLFDLDGTLVDSAELILESWRHTMRIHFGETPDDGVWLASVGQPLRAQFRAFVPTDEDVHPLVETYLEHNHREHARLIRAFPGVQETLEALTGRGQRLGIVTSKAARGTALSLETCGLDPAWFDVIVTADEPVPHKPDPAPVRLALERMDLEPRQAAFVGDSVWDLRAGRGAGVVTVAALWGPFDEALLAGEGPDHMLADVAHLVDPAGS